MLSQARVAVFALLPVILRSIDVIACNEAALVDCLEHVEIAICQRLVSLSTFPSSAILSIS
jgi:hypothetical protein